MDYKIYNGDCLDVMNKYIDMESADLVLTDPQQKQKIQVIVYRRGL